jgi:outer membrane protein OmpA-like peptidoglycan-associated protein
MRYLSIIPALLMICAFPVQAQVTVDLNALDQLKDTTPAPKPAAPKAKAPPKPAAAKRAPPETPPPPGPASAPGPGPAAAPPTAKTPPGFHAPLPPLPTTPPADAALAPLPPPTAPANKPSSTPPPPPVAANAAGTGAAFPGGLRITFGNGQGELSPASEQSLKTLVSQAPKSETVSYNVLAYAPGTPEDPSTARRLSLARALAVRSVLMSAGVPSTRIYVRALGAPSGNASPDRADVSVLGANAPPPELALPPPDAAAPEPGMTEPGATEKPMPQTGAAKTP